ncbi:DUF695 domain-containing protein [Chryseolinea serpens]|nr:DUF695 domain-containing protein [Chryseolinea serpens]
MNHEQEWDFYFSNVDGKPGSFYLDMGLKDVAPVNSMPHFFCVSLKMNDPREDGLSSDREYDTLIEIENHLEDGIKDKRDIVYAGRLTFNGMREFYFYTADPLLVEKTISESLVRFPNYACDFEVKDDKEWLYYLDFMYPDPRQVQSILNRRVIDSLEKNGDKLTKPREVNHWIYFRSIEAREKFIEQVKEKGFNIDGVETLNDREFKYQLRISRVDGVRHRDVNQYVLYLWELAGELDGEYDGWETSIEAE